MQDPPPEYSPLEFDPESLSPSEESEAASKGGLRSVIIEIVETLLLAVILFLGINTISARIQVDGRSMEPSFVHGEYVIVNKLAYRFGEFQRGDVIVFPFPYNEEEDYIKRVIGLPGDHVELRDGQVYVNGQRLDEPYIQEAARRDFSEMLVPDDAVFVMGDNRNDSSDSREWGPLSMDSVIGKALFVYWPPSRVGVVEPPDNELVPASQ